MNERVLRIFNEFCILKNMTLVAEKLYISQPAVSQAIKELEKELRVLLVDRKNKMALTDAGEVYFEYVKRILRLYDESYGFLQDIARMKKGRMKIGASTTIGIYILPDIIGQFIKQYDGIDVALAIENTKQITDKVLEGAIDFAFVEGVVNEPDIVIEEYCIDELTMIVPPDHMWVKAGIVNVQDLSKEKIIMRESGSGTREVFENALTTHHAQYSIALELGNTEAIKNAVAAGIGLSCVSARCIKKELTAGSLVAVKLDGIEFIRRLNLIYHRDKDIIPLFHKFIDFARATINNYK